MHLPHITPFSRCPIYYFTAATCERQRVLANQATYDCLTGLWKKSLEIDGWCVGRFVIMPDHLHVFSCPREDAHSRALWLKMWKSVSARQLSDEIGVPLPLWQADTFDHILRSAKSYSAKWDYVKNNPVRHGLVKNSDDWPWQGEINVFGF